MKTRARGGLDEDFWSAGLRWVPGANTSAEARFGQRFFGDSYYVAIERRARALLIEAAYSEEPTVETLPSRHRRRSIPASFHPITPARNPVACRRIHSSRRMGVLR